VTDLGPALVRHAEDGRLDTAAWSVSTASTSAGCTFSPPEVYMSLMRSTMK